MKSSTVTAQFSCDCKTVWDIVTDNTNYSWRSDISEIKVINETRFDEYTTDGFVTHFQITAKQACKEYRFSMENKNMSGSWSGIFESSGSKTKITFTEEVSVKNPIMNILAIRYLKEQQKKYISDLAKVLGVSCEILQ